jgi:glycerate-2-kinase
MIVKNRNEIATTELRRQALDIVEAGISRVLPSALMSSAVDYDPRTRSLVVHSTVHDIGRGRLFVVGGGKAVGLMAESLEAIIGAENLAAGVVTCTDSTYGTKVIEIVEASHPTPDERGESGVRQMLSLQVEHSIGQDDMVICLISGGGSALMPLPVAGVTLEDKQETTRQLLRSGAEIREINVVRKHISRVKGGRLGQHFSPAAVVSLMISDVVGNDLESIASGPTVPDSSTFADACDVLERYALSERIPSSVRDFLDRGRKGIEEETPKVLHNCSNFIIGDNMLALQAMSAKAREVGLTPHIVTAEQKGDTTAAATRRAQEIAHGKYAGYDVVLIGGETTSTLPEKTGRGGRNQHYAAASMLAMKEFPGDWVLASVGTDGSDFGRDAAGGIVDNDSLEAARAASIDVESYLDSYDSNTLFRKMGRSLVVTGHTGTNVSDIMVYILRQRT